MNVSLNDDILSPVPPTNLLDEDEFISDDDDSNDSSVDLPASNDNEKNQLLDVLRKSHGLLLRIRKMVKIMRNVSSIDQNVRNHEHGPCNGFVIDIRVCLTFLHILISENPREYVQIKSHTHIRIKNKLD